MRAVPSNLTQPHATEQNIAAKTGICSKITWAEVAGAGPRLEEKNDQKLISKIKFIAGADR